MHEEMAQQGVAADSLRSPLSWVVGVALLLGSRVYLADR